MVKKQKKSPEEYYSYNAGYCVGKIIKLFRKANQNHKYSHAIHLLKNHRDILCKQPYFDKLINFQYIVLKCKRLNQFSWSKLSRYERYMFCEVLDYALLKHIWEKKLISYWEVYEMADYIDFDEKPSIVRYLNIVIQLRYHKLMCMNKYVRHLNEFDLYFLTHHVVKNIQNDLIDMSAIKYYIYSMIVPIPNDDTNEYKPLLRRYVNCTYDELDKAPSVKNNDAAINPRLSRSDELLYQATYHSLIYNTLATSTRDRLIEEYNRFVDMTRLKN